MPAPSRAAFRQSLAPLLVLTGTTIVLLMHYEPRLDGHVHGMGADYSAFLPRLLAGAYWVRTNGWGAIQWFWPAFCGGMPAWANPQSMPYSLPQVLTSLFDPVTAIQLTYAVFAALGATGTFVLLRSGFRTSTAAALLGSVLFLFNGFYTREMLVGHITFHPFMLTPWVTWLLVRETPAARARVVDGIAAGVLIAIMIQAGMFGLLVPVGLAWLALGLLHATRFGRLGAFSMRLGVALTVGAALSASKLAAMGAFAQQFPRDFYLLGGFNDPWALLLGAFRSVFFRVGATFTGAVVHLSIVLPADEWECGLTPIPLLLFAAAILRRRGAPTPPIAGRRWMIAGLVALCLVPLAVNFYTPAWNAALKSLPLIRSNVTLLRWFVFYIPVVVVLTALALDRLGGSAVVAGLGILGVLLWAPTLMPPTGNELAYAPKNIVKAWQSLTDGNPVPAIEYMDVRLEADGSAPTTVWAGDDDLALGASQAFCYEPLFGYQHEKLPWQPLHSGSPLEASNGVLNVKNPACELFPSENHCLPGDQFSTAAIDSATAFVSWEPFPFERPLRQRLADGLNVVALLFVIGVTTVGVARRLRPGSR